MEKANNSQSKSKEPVQEIENLTISNSLKGILYMKYNIEKSELHVIEN